MAIEYTDKFGKKRYLDSKDIQLRVSARQLFHRDRLLILQVFDKLNKKDTGHSLSDKDKDKEKEKVEIVGNLAHYISLVRFDKRLVVGLLVGLLAWIALFTCLALFLPPTPLFFTMIVMASLTAFVVLPACWSGILSSLPIKPIDENAEIAKELTKKLKAFVSESSHIPKATAKVTQLQNGSHMDSSLPPSYSTSVMDSSTPSLHSNTGTFFFKPNAVDPQKEVQSGESLRNGGSFATTLTPCRT
jgi:hypothetical protein